LGTATIEELANIRGEARRLADRFTFDYWREHDRDAAYPWEFVRTFADHGWLSVMIPEEYGGMGLGITEAAVMMESVAASGAGLTGGSALHFYVFPPAPVIRHGSEGMKRRYLPAVAGGELLMAFSITEPGAGTDTSRITTRARRENGHWVIHGQKIWATNAQNATKVLLLTRTSERDERRPLEGMTLFLCDLDRSRVEVREIEKLGRAAVDSNELFIDGLIATDDDIVGEVGKGFSYLLDGLNPERIVVAMEAIGIGRAALTLAVDYANERVVFGRPIGANQAIAHPLAEQWARLEAAERLALHAANLYDAKQPCGKETNAAKFLAADAGFKAADAALQTLGGFGYAKEYHVERLWREVRLFRLAPISQEMVLNYLATNALGLPRSY
jgi:alkylation response protein AidB-like acyl-CoA dehydrogenase